MANEDEILDGLTVERLLSALEAEEREIIRAVYFEDQNAEDVGRYALAKALQKLRHAAGVRVQCSDCGRLRPAMDFSAHELFCGSCRRARARKRRRQKRLERAAERARKAIGKANHAE